MDWKRLMAGFCGRSCAAIPSDVTGGTRVRIAGRRFRLVPGGPHLWVHAEPRLRRLEIGPIGLCEAHVLVLLDGSEDLPPRSSSWRWPQETLVDGVRVNDGKVVRCSILAYQRGSRGVEPTQTGDQMRKSGSDSSADTYISTRRCLSADRTTFRKLLTSACTC